MFIFNKLEFVLSHASFMKMKLKNYNIMIINDVEFKEEKKNSCMFY